MAKVFQMLEKMGLVRMQSGPDEPPVAAEPDEDAVDESLGIMPGPPPEEVEAIPPERFDGAVVSEGEGLSPEDYPFDKVYASAGIVEPEHGFTVDRLIEMMGAAEFRDLDPATRARVIAGMLRRLPTGAVEVADIVREAALRDQALDAFERFLADRVAAVDREIEEANRVLQQEIDELVEKNTALMETNRARAGAERDRLERWREGKHAEEDRLYQAVQPFVEANPVTRSGGPAADELPDGGSESDDGQDSHSG
jgi:hypothetical protein